MSDWATSGARDEFLRRYATSPMHVARLERFLQAYGFDGTEEAFAAAYLQWDRACPDPEAARIVTEILSGFRNERGEVVRLSDDALRGAIRWIAHPTLPPAVRARRLKLLCSSTDRDARLRAPAVLEKVAVLSAAELEELVQSSM